MISKYVMALHVPIYADGETTYVATDWKRSLELLRDSLADEVGEFVYLGPRGEVSDSPDQRLVPFGPDAGWRLKPSFDFQAGRREYWISARRQWQRDVGAEMSTASVAHLGLNDLFRPVNYDALRVGLNSNAKTVFVRDTDEVLKIRDLLATGLIKKRPYWPAYLAAYERTMRFAVSRADLSLLKGQALFDRYATFARNPQTFEDTSFSQSDIISQASLGLRVNRLQQGSPIRFVYCGRLEKRKGVDRSIRIVADARALGADLSFDIIGDGAERKALEALVADLGLHNFIRFLGRRDYGAELFECLSTYDALLFTPYGEDTPRMIFDGYCAGLPLVAHDIAYVRERSAGDRCVVELPRTDADESARIVADMSKNHAELARLAFAAREAAFRHSAEQWYKRRADWTLELFEGAQYADKARIA